MSYLLTTPDCPCVCNCGFKTLEGLCSWCENNLYPDAHYIGEEQ